MPVIEETPPPFPPALFVATLASAAALVVLSFYYVRGGTLLGLDSVGMRASVAFATLAFFSCLGYGAWRARRRARSR